MDRGDGRPRLIGDYILGPKIGSGSFAVVWRSTHRVYGWEVAIKEIDRKQLNDSLVKEITILRQINHPNIIRLHDAIETPDKIYLVLEYCTGGDLAGYIQRFGRVSEVAARHFMRQLASGLQVLRHNNLIHRDLKPQNLLLSTHDETPVLKIGDFGFARYLKPQALADTLCGSPLYMAPEIIQNQKYDAKADLWSVGAILFQLVTGKPPFDGNNQFQLFQNVTSNELQFPRGVIEELNPDCVELCKSLLRRNPVERLAFEEFFNHKFLVEPRLNVDVGCSSSMQDGRTHLEHEERTSVNESKMHSSGLAYSSIPSSKSVSCFSVYDENIFMPKKELGRSNSANRKFPSEMISTVSPKESVDGGRSKSSDLQSTMTECLDQRLLAMNISEVGDSLERIEQEYVLVNAHVSSTYTLSSSLEASAQYHSADILTESSLKKISKGKSAPLQTGQLGVSSVCGVESLGFHESASSATSVASTELVEVPGLSSSHPSARLCLLRQYALALSELAKEKLDVGLHLESFSVELVALAVWQEALRLCKCWVSSTSAADSCPSAVANEGSQDQEGEGLNFNKPSSVFSWFEQGFLVALGRAEKFYSHLRDMDANAEMPDAIEIIFQTALAAGRHGGAEELIGSRNAAVSYSKATVLLSFILTEATSLPLKPPFSLSVFDRQRLQRYIINLKSHQNRVLGLPKSPDHPCGFPK